MYESSKQGLRVSNLTGEQILQLQALRQGQGELAVLLPQGQKFQVKADSARAYAELTHANLVGTL